MNFSSSKEWEARARRTVPNGLPGHYRSYVFTPSQQVVIPEDYPHFLASAEGCRFQDVDGNEYIDYLCGYGSMIVGYNNSRINAAITNQLGRGLCNTFLYPVYIELAEKLVNQHQFADWINFSLNGSDAIAMALTLARAHTNRSGVIVAEGAFHGNQSWCSLGLGRIAADLSETHFVSWGEIGQIEVVLQNSDDIAAIVLCPYEQLVGAPNRIARSGYWKALRQLCDRAGSLLVIDDVRSGFRVSPSGACDEFGIQPDLVCISKAIANGHPLAAVMGSELLKATAENIFVSGTFWGYTLSLVAALETQKILHEEEATTHMAKMGRMLTSGLEELARAHGFELTVSGIDAMPMVQFSQDWEDVRLMRLFARELASLGSFIHPTHNWFLSLAHQAGDIEQTLLHAEKAFPVLKQYASDDHRSQ